MQVSPIIQASREHKIDQVMTITGCSRDRAISYLFSAKWFVPDAVMSFNVDLEIKVAKAAAIQAINNQG